MASRNPFKDADKRREEQAGMSAGELAAAKAGDNAKFAPGGGKSAATQGARNVDAVLTPEQKARQKRMAKARKGIAAGRRATTVAKLLQPGVNIQKGRQALLKKLGF